MLGYWDRMLAARGRPRAGLTDMLLHAARFTNDNGGGEGGGGGDEGKGGGGGSKESNNKPAWADEFGDNFDPERAWNTIKTLREAERTLKRENGTLTGKVKDYEGASKTETEKLSQRLQDLEDENKKLKGAERARSLQAQIADVARQAGAHYPDDVYRLLDEGSFEFEGDRIKNAAKLVGELKQGKPALFGNASGDGQKGRQQSGAQDTDMNSLIRRSAGRV